MVLLPAMNIAQPVSSTIESVEFTFLSADEIRSISVKRIDNETTFDSLLNPVPGGLYDPALGSWGDSLYGTPGAEVLEDHSREMGLGLTIDCVAAEHAT